MAWVVFLVLLLISYSVSRAQETTYKISDDGYAYVPLPFTFNFYNKSFTESWMYDNGIISFINPQLPGAISPGQWSAPSSINASGGNYFIAALWADLAPTSSTKYSTSTDGTYLKYSWSNISEYYSGGTRLNSFSTTIKPSGDIFTNYYSLHLNSTNVLAGTAGNLSLGEHTQEHSLSSSTEIQGLSNWQLTGKQDPCSSNPYYSPSCEGFKKVIASGQLLDSTTQNSLNVDSSTTTETPQASVANPVAATQTPSQNSASRTTVLPTSQRVLSSIRNTLQATVNTETEAVDQAQQQAQTTVSSALSEQIIAHTVTNVPPLRLDQNLAQITFSEPLPAETTQKVATTQELSIVQQSMPTEIADVSASLTTVNKAAKDSSIASNVSISDIAKQPQGFELYSLSFKDPEFYASKTIYQAQKVVDNDAARRLLNFASKSRYKQMLQDQYK